MQQVSKKCFFISKYFFKYSFIIRYACIYGYAGCNSQKFPLNFDDVRENSPKIFTRIFSFFSDIA